MMFGAALRKAPFERAMPFNESDLMILISPEIGFRLCNITTEAGLTFKIEEFMAGEPKVFGENFKQRIVEFAEIFQGRVERFFETKKSDYIFFDEEEQKFLRKLMSKQGLSCSVEIYRFFKDKSPERIDFLELPYEEAMKVSKFLSACKVRSVINCREYYYLAKKNYDETKDRTSRFNNFKAKSNDEMEQFFKKYPKLKGLDSQERVDKYFKKLTIKYHPDSNNGETHELCASIQQDLGVIRNSTWYLRLPERKEGDK